MLLVWLHPDAIQLKVARETSWSFNSSAQYALIIHGCGYTDAILLLVSKRSKQDTIKDIPI